MQRASADSQREDTDEMCECGCSSEKAMVTSNEKKGMESGGKVNIRKEY